MTTTRDYMAETKRLVRSYAGLKKRRRKARLNRIVHLWHIRDIRTRGHHAWAQRRVEAREFMAVIL